MTVCKHKKLLDIVSEYFIVNTSDFRILIITRLVFPDYYVNTMARLAYPEKYTIIVCYPNIF